MEEDIKVIEIFWDDFEAFPGWHDEEAVKDLIEEHSSYRTVGYVIHRNSNHLFIGASACSDGGFAEIMKIPISQIRAERELQ